MIPFQTLLAENAPFLGTFVQSAAPEYLEASAYAGFRFAAIDLEHTYYGVEQMAELIRAGEAAGLSMLARVPALDAVWIKKSLDFGAAGVIVPNIDTPEQAAQAVLPVPAAVRRALRELLRSRRASWCRKPPPAGSGPHSGQGERLLPLQRAVA